MLCAYDYNSGAPTLVYQSTVPAADCSDDRCWTVQAGRGARYNDRKALADGISKMVLLVKTSGQARVVVKGRGSSLPIPVMPLTQDSSVVFQLVNSVGECWESSFVTPPDVNTESIFKDN